MHFTGSQPDGSISTYGNDSETLKMDFSLFRTDINPNRPDQTITVSLRIIMHKETVICGAGGSRTLVQTGKPYAFYTLIPDFCFRAAARPGPPTTALVPELHPYTGTCADYSRFACTACSRRFGKTSLERCPVPSPCDGIKLIIYCTSIKQREHTYCCQLNFCPL